MFMTDTLFNLEYVVFLAFQLFKNGQLYIEKSNFVSALNMKSNHILNVSFKASISIFHRFFAKMC